MGRTGAVGVAGKEGIEKFCKEDVQFLIAHPKTGGEGLNLQMANTMIFFNSGMIGTILREQSEGRIYRAGQKKKCLYLDIVMEGSVDEVLYNSLKKNTDYVKDLLDYFNLIKKST